MFSHSSSFRLFNLFSDRRRASSSMTCNNKTLNLCLLNRVAFLYLVISSWFLCRIQIGFAIDLAKSGSNDKILDTCQRCKILTESFKEGLRRTSRGKHEGGDAHWEENKLSNYATSEIRLIDIQESLCHEVSAAKDQCHSFAEEHETELEEWFFRTLKNSRKKKTVKEEGEEEEEEGSSLFDDICNVALKVCCPAAHFGPDCAPCPGFPDAICNGRGYCAGNGTRETGKRSGKCVCFRGFSGAECDRCAKNYFPANPDDNRDAINIPEKCERCDRSCASSCDRAGPTGCHACRSGYEMDSAGAGCVDVNECTSMEIDPCKAGTYCANTAGSYKCYQCHKACRGCVSAGDHSCIECAPDYHRQSSAIGIGNRGRCLPNDLPWYQWYGSWFRESLAYPICITLVIGLIARRNATIGFIAALLAALAIYKFELPRTSSTNNPIATVHRMLLDKWNQFFS